MIDFETVKLLTAGMASVLRDVPNGDIHTIVQRQQEEWSTTASADSGSWNITVILMKSPA